MSAASKIKLVRMQFADYDVFLGQRGPDDFLILYGQQSKENLTYEEAATELGACLMHAAACNGQIDNGSKGER